MKNLLHKFPKQVSFCNKKRVPYLFGFWNYNINEQKHGFESDRIGVICQRHCNFGKKNFVEEKREKIAKEKQAILEEFAITCVDVLLQNYTASMEVICSN